MYWTLKNISLVKELKGNPVVSIKNATGLFRRHYKPNIKSQKICKSIVNLLAGIVQNFKWHMTMWILFKF